MKLLGTLPAAIVAMALVSCDRFGGDQDSDGPGEEGHADEHDDEGGMEQDERGPEVMLSAAAIERSGIVLAPVTKQILQATLTAPARVSFNLEAIAHIGTLVPGRIIEIRARVGDRVSRGDALLLLESPALGQAQIDLLHRRALLDAAGPAIELARSAYERARSLHESQSGVTLTEVQDREAILRAAEAAARTAEADLRAATDSLRLLGFDQRRIDALIETGAIDPLHTIIAPISGEIIEREVTVGEFVDTGRDALLVVADLSELWVLADVPEVYLGRVAPGARARISVAGSTESFEGEISYIAPSIDPHTRAGQVRIVLLRNGTVLRPGAFAQAEIEIADSGSTGEVLAVPEAAIQEIEGETVVFVPVPGEDNTFAPRTVSVLPGIGGMVPVLDGLEEGEPVIVRGSFILKAELGKGEAGHDHDH